ncbi:bifunctional riboflavin kinase/FAD synthetase [Bartonella henselae]|uniref:bifunctional riboflavin kinase/FAD synthetase n=1 Tax=Bartonella henselae TaxID=38323 RepID=UPI00095DFB2F|nr:bifunctional riboflavin kinase/FAD synthetase [Bartonella henselae]OLL54996.1 bifunctional riboflavin kinase/FMN adenylyltransferase [Bartonella henselae]OLL56166.1 bifunctional riboflavin kinase/FMN adenylyltransferase [Bartonella henselae]UJM33507.1 bifunctional riboflavin kinase/FAD synthetase [Bartonella henselae]
MSDFLRLQGIDMLPLVWKGAVLALGNFDGVHCGHQMVLQKALDLARMRNKPALVLTFEPHPRSFFQHSAPIDRLTEAPEKAEIFKILGFNGVIEQPFDAHFAALSADEFINVILKKAFEVSVVVTGENFQFGRQKSGNSRLLCQKGEEWGFEVVQIPCVSSAPNSQSVIISSSVIRKLLSQGQVEKAARLLGYHYRVRSNIIQGEQLGRLLGFPTANQILPPQASLAHGVYAVRLRRVNGVLYDGVASFGCRPTVVKNAAPFLETYLFDFNGDLYGENCTVSFFQFLRKQEKFDGLEPLIAQMHHDKKKAKAILAAVQPLSQLDQLLTFKNRT